MVMDNSRGGGRDVMFLLTRNVFNGKETSCPCRQCVY